MTHTSKDQFFVAFLFFSSTNVSLFEHVFQLFQLLWIDDVLGGLVGRRSEILHSTFLKDILDVLHLLWVNIEVIDIMAIFSFLSFKNGLLVLLLQSKLSTLPKGIRLRKKPSL